MARAADPSTPPSFAFVDIDGCVLNISVLTALRSELQGKGSISQAAFYAILITYNSELLDILKENNVSRIFSGSARTSHALDSINAHNFSGYIYQGSGLAPDPVITNLCKTDNLLRMISMVSGLEYTGSTIRSVLCDEEPEIPEPVTASDPDRLPSSSVLKLRRKPPLAETMKINSMKFWLEITHKAGVRSLVFIDDRPDILYHINSHINAKSFLPWDLKVCMRTIQYEGPSAASAASAASAPAERLAMPARSPSAYVAPTSRFTLPPAPAGKTTIPAAPRQPASGKKRKRSDPDHPAEENKRHAEMPADALDDQRAPLLIPPLPMGGLLRRTSMSHAESPADALDDLLMPAFPMGGLLRQTSMSHAEMPADALDDLRIPPLPMGALLRQTSMSHAESPADALDDLRIPPLPMGALLRQTSMSHAESPADALDDLRIPPLPMGALLRQTSMSHPEIPADALDDADTSAATPRL